MIGPLVRSTALVFLLAGPLLAQTAAPDLDLPAELLVRGPGFYLSWVKILAFWLVFVAWVASGNWVNMDSQTNRLNHVRWNSLVFGVFLGAFVVTWVLPWFWLNFLLLLAAYLVPLILYISHRNEALPPHRQVLTPDHLYFLGASVLNRLGVKVALERRAQADRGSDVTLKGRGGPTPRDEEARLGIARQTPGFLPARQILAGGLDVRATAIRMDFLPQAVAVWHQIDGVWIEAEPIGRELGDPALESLKTLCGMDPGDRVRRQEGLFLAELDGVAHHGSLVSQGVSGGERVIVEFPAQRFVSNSLDELGMRPKMREQLMETLGTEHGLVLFSAMPGSGLRTTMNAALCTMDRFTHDFMALEAESSRYVEVENVPVITYRGAEGAGVALRTLLLREPEVVVVRDLVDAAMVRALCQKAATNKQVVCSIRAKEASEALARVLALDVPAGELAKAVSAVLHQRLVRKLCPDCKEAYRPTPQVLQQLNVPADRVQAFYRPPSQRSEGPCPTCGGIGYVGRTAIYELVVLDVRFRQVLASGAKLDVLRKAARQAGSLSLQEEGLVLVAKGITSLPELARVLAE